MSFFDLIPKDLFTDVCEDLAKLDPGKYQQWLSRASQVKEIWEQVRKDDYLIYEFENRRMFNKSNKALQKWLDVCAEEIENAAAVQSYSKQNRGEECRIKIPLWEHAKRPEIA